MIRKDLGIPLKQILIRKSSHSFYKTSSYTLSKLMADPNNIRDNAESYINSFSPNDREIFEKYEFDKQLDKLNDNNLLYLIVENFSSFDLIPQNVSNHDMGLLFEELIRKFAEQSNETAGEHFAPRDIVRLATSLLFRFILSTLIRYCILYKKNYFNSWVILCLSISLA